VHCLFWFGVLMFHEMISHIQGSLDAQNGYKYYLHSEYLSSPLHTFLFPELPETVIWRLYTAFAGPCCACESLIALSFTVYPIVRSTCGNEFIGLTTRRMIKGYFLGTKLGCCRTAGNSHSCNKSWENGGSRNKSTEVVYGGYFYHASDDQ
jgi:hypothetical protein